MFVFDQKDNMALVSELDRLLERGSDADLEGVAAVLGRHATPDLLRGVLHAGLVAAASSIGEGVLFRSGLVSLANGPAYSLDLRYAFEVRGDDMVPTGSKGHLLARAGDIVIANIGPRPLSGTRYSIQQKVDFDKFDPSAILQSDGEWLLEPGQSLVVEAGKQIASVTDASGARFLSLSLPPRWSLEWLFDRETMRPVAQSAAHVDDSQLVTCLELAGWLRDGDTEEAILALTRHRAHFVRWKAIQALGALNPSSAMPLVVSAAGNDPHPAVRRAAAATLSRHSETPALENC
ncbi:MAG TPA: HEAT repeat domain-containing protein [Allosphingosinicella sp.]|nr:HEAT repeat domain-containing protein [Allosphingosinicella sp.]